VSHHPIAVFGVRHPIGSRLLDKSRVPMLGAGKEIRTPDLLIASKLKLSGVPISGIANGTRIARERDPPT
jgi:hypothetical protein